MRSLRLGGSSRRECCYLQQLLPVSGPNAFAATAREPRMEKWDNGAVHGASALVATSAPNVFACGVDEKT